MLVKIGDKSCFWSSQLHSPTLLFGYIFLFIVVMTEKQTYQVPQIKFYKKQEGLSHF